MADSSKTCDVFISHAAGDVILATEIAHACRANGLNTVTSAELLSGANMGDAVWEALAESRALLAILPPSGPTPSIAIELGAAQAWDKPIFGIVTDPALAQLPLNLSNIRMYPSGRIADIIGAIKQSGLELSDEERSFLGKAYDKVGVPVDRLALEPSRLAKLVQRFRSTTGKAVSGERLLSELLRMRKQGKLTKGHSGDQPKTHRGAATP